MAICLASTLSTQTTALLDKLDPEQRAAVTHQGGPCLVLAGPGAGKTRTLTHRVAYLIDQGVAPSEIIVCTFTRKATEEMQDRLSVLIGTQVAALGLGTIHATCYRLLRQLWKTTNTTPYELMGEGMQSVMLSMLLDEPWARNEIGLGLASKKIRTQDLSMFFAACRDGLLTPDVVNPQSVPLLVGDRWQEIIDECQAFAVRPAVATDWIVAYCNYQRVKEDRHLIDFDDMTPMLWHAWQKDASLLQYHQRKFQHVLVDEFQDTSYGQWEVIRKLAAPQNNIYCVGDECQSMYSFRFARPEFTLHFNHFYPNATIYAICTNYRSVPDVVEKSSLLIAHNTERVPRELHAHREHPGYPAIGRIEPANEVAESDEIVKCIVVNHNGHWDDVAILYRTNRYSAEMELACLRAGVPYRIVGGMSFFNNRPVADMLAYLRLAVDPTDSKAFARALTSPARFLGKEYIRRVQATAGIGGDLLQHIDQGGGTSRQVDTARMFASLIRSLSPEPEKAVLMIRNATDYDKWYLSRAKTTEDESSDHLEILDTLGNVAHGFDSNDELVAYADAVLESANDEGDDKPRVTMTTIHRAKGLEWPVVFIAGMVDGLIPHVRAYSGGPRAMEEERRIAYVAMTRARDRLFLSNPYLVAAQQVDMSPFIGEAGLL